MGIQKFEDIIAWKKAQDLSFKIYSQFNKNSDFSFRNQITKASISISNNIAEGFERKSRKEFSRFIEIAISSNSEVRSMLYLAPRLDYLSQDKAKILIEMTNEISKILYGLRKSLSTNT